MTLLKTVVDFGQYSSWSKQYINQSKQSLILFKRVVDTSGRETVIFSTVDDTIVKQKFEFVKTVAVSTSKNRSLHLANSRCHWSKPKCKFVKNNNLIIIKTMQLLETT